MSGINVPADFEWGASHLDPPSDSPEPDAERPARPTQTEAPAPTHQATQVPALPIPRVRMDLGDIMAERFPGFDPVEFMVEVALDQSWPKSLRLQAVKDAARYLRPVVTPEHGTGDRGTIIIVDQTREAAARGDLAALRALGQDDAASPSPGSDGDLRPVTIDQDAVVIDPELTS